MVRLHKQFQIHTRHYLIYSVPSLPLMLIKDFDIPFHTMYIIKTHRVQQVHSLSCFEPLRIPPFSANIPGGGTWCCMDTITYCHTSISINWLCGVERDERQK